MGMVSAELSARQCTTLEVGSAVLLGVLVLGLEVARWSPWSTPVVVAGYCAWVIAYAELTVRVERLRSRRHQPLAQAEPPPADEE
jgi:hypothetical protein